MLEIARLQLQKTAKLLIDQQVALTVEPKALEELAKEGFDPTYGARPLRRLIQSAIENPIATLLIQKQFIAGDTIVVDYDGVKKIYTFQKKTLPQPVSPTAAAQPAPPVIPVPKPPVPPVSSGGAPVTPPQNPTAPRA
jgi:ATP-dependent Clp protease ATP-binding subunit ClpB